MLQHKHHRFVDKLVRTCFPFREIHSFGLSRMLRQIAQCESGGWICMCTVYTVHKPSRHIGIFPFNVYCKPTRFRAQFCVDFSLTHSLTLSLHHTRYATYIKYSICPAPWQPSYMRLYVRTYQNAISHRCHTINILMHECYAVVVHPLRIGHILIHTVLEHRAYFIFHFKLLTHAYHFIHSFVRLVHICHRSALCLDALVPVPVLVSLFDGSHCIVLLPHAVHKVFYLVAFITIICV